MEHDKQREEQRKCVEQRNKDLKVLLECSYKDVDELKETLKRKYDYHIDEIKQAHKKGLVHPDEYREKVIPELQAKINDLTTLSKQWKAVADGFEKDKKDLNEICDHAENECRKLKALLDEDRLKKVTMDVYPNIQEQAEEYEMRGDDGDYSPNEQERFLMTDFCIGVMEQYQEDLIKAIKGE